MGDESRTDPANWLPPTPPRPARQGSLGAVGAAVLAFAAVMFVTPSVVVDAGRWQLTTATARSISAFLAFPAVTWLWFLFDERWSSFRITQQTAGLGMVLIGVGALRAGMSSPATASWRSTSGRWPWAWCSSSACSWSWTAGRRGSGAVSG